MKTAESKPVQVHIQIPAGLHQAMWAIRNARHKQEGTDVKLSRIYREAVEQYVQAEPQQKVVSGRRQKVLRRTA